MGSITYRGLAFAGGGTSEAAFVGTLVLPRSISKHEVARIRVRFQPFEFDLESGELWKDAVPVRLQPQPAKVLRLLVERAGNLVGREDIQKALWADETFVDFDQGLNYCIRQIRIALEDSAEQPQFIVTVPRRGYRFGAEVSYVTTPPAPTPPSPEPILPAQPAPIPTPIVEQPVAPRSEPIPPSTTRGNRWEFGQLAVGIPAVLFLAGLIYFGAWRWRQANFVTTIHHDASANSGAIPLRTSVAVLGFANLNGVDKDGWLSTAISEMLSTELSEGGKLRLISGEEVAKARPGHQLPESLSKETLSTLRQQLGTDVVVLGSYAILAQDHVRKLRLDLRLQDARSGQVLAAFAQTGDESDLFNLVAGTGAKLRQQLGIRALSATEEASFDHSFPTDPEARRLYAEGLDRLRHFDALGARESLEQALKIEPRFAPGRSALAAAWSALGYNARAIEEAKKATELTEDLSREEQLSIEARYYEMVENGNKASETLRTLVSFFPDSIEYGIRLANVYMIAGRKEDALATVARLRQLPDPVGTSPRLDLMEAQIYSRSGDFRKSRTLVEEAVSKGRAIGAQRFVAQALLTEAFVLERLSLPDDSLKASAEARQINTTVNFPRGIALSLLMNGDVLYDKGEFVAARERFETALSFFKEIGDTRNVGMSLERIGNTYHDQGKFAESQNDYQHALDIYRQIQWPSGVCSALGNLANTLDSLGDLKGALKMHQEALQIFQQTGQKRGTASEIDNIANVYFEQGNLPAALEQYRKSIAMHRETGYQRGEMYALNGLGDVLQLQNNLDGARKQYLSGRTIADKTQQKNELARIDVSLAFVDYYQGNLAAAEKKVTDAAVQLQKDKDPEGEVLATALLIHILLAEKKLPEANAAGKRTETSVSEVTSIPPQFEAGIALAELEIANGKKDAARRRLLPLLDRARKGGYLQYELEFRRLLASMDTGQARIGHLNAVSAEAKQKGFGLIVEEVARMSR